MNTVILTHSPHCTCQPEGFKKIHAGKIIKELKRKLANAGGAEEAEGGAFDEKKVTIIVGVPLLAEDAELLDKFGKDESEQ